MPNRLSNFAFEVKPLEEGGTLLNICGTEYKAWRYDTYIYDAIEIAKKWRAEEVTYERVTHVREWIKENYSHGHNYNFEEVDTISDIKKIIDDIIKAEYQIGDTKNANSKAIRDGDLKRNTQIFAS